MKALMTDKAIFEMQAEICKTLTNPKRIEILNALQTEEKTVTEIGVPIWKREHYADGTREWVDPTAAKAVVTS